jgi:predicted ATP-grasp superfamily ATP-dependent carboligase
VISIAEPMAGARIMDGGAAAPRATFDALVLDAHFRQALVTVRSLGRRGRAVAALDTVRNVPAFASRWCAQAFVREAPLGSEAYLAHLEAVLARTPARVLIPSHDGTIALIRRHRAELEGRVRIALAREPAMAIAVSKERTLAVADGLGIRIPRTRIVGRVSEVDAAVTHIGLPAVVKPDESWMAAAGRYARLGVRLVRTRDEAHQVVAEMSALGGTALFQQVLTGRREAVSFLYAGGTTYARFAQWAERTGPPLGGESLLRQSIAVPDDIGAQAERLIQAIDLDGYSEVEFRRDAAGVPYLMEINPRLSASVEMAVRSGVDFPTLIYQWAAGERIETVRGYRTGGWMRHFGGDLMNTLAIVRGAAVPGGPSRGRAIADFFLSSFRPMAYDYLDWRDPLPAVMATADFARRMSASTLRRTLRRS